MMEFLSFKNTFGGSIVSLLVAIAIAGGLALVVTKMSKLGIDSSKHTEIANEKERLRQYVVSNVSCRKTRLKANLRGCDAKKANPIDLYNESGNILISWKAKKVSNWP